MPEALIVPGVFTDRQRGASPAEMHQMLLLRRSKISLFIEHVIERQQHLRLHEGHFPAAHQRRRIHHPLPCSRRSRRNIAHNAGNIQFSCCLGNFRNRLFRARNKRGLFKKICRWISADREFRKENKISTTFGCLAREIENLLYISGEIADSGIDLSERNLHSSSVAILLCYLFPRQLHCNHTITRRNWRSTQNKPVAFALVVAQLRCPEPIGKETYLDMMSNRIAFDCIRPDVGDVVALAAGALCLMPASRRAQAPAHVSFSRIKQIADNVIAPRLLYCSVFMQK